METRKPRQATAQRAQPGMRRSPAEGNGEGLRRSGMLLFPDETSLQQQQQFELLGFTCPNHKRLRLSHLRTACSLHPLSIPSTNCQPAQSLGHAQRCQGAASNLAVTAMPRTSVESPSVCNSSAFEKGSQTKPHLPLASPSERRPLISSVPIVGCEAKLLRTEWNHANMLQMLRFLDVPNLAATISLKVLHFWGLLRESWHLYLEHHPFNLAQASSSCPTKCTARLKLETS